jgi:hypothetical protein
VEEKKQERKDRALMCYEVIYAEMIFAMKQYEMTTVLLDGYRWLLLKKDMEDHLQSLKILTDQWGEWVNVKNSSVLMLTTV